MNKYETVFIINPNVEESGVKALIEKFSTLINNDGKVEKVEKEASDFFGEWEATSDQGHYLYGSVDITVKEDGTWEGAITGEPLNGTWEDKGDHLHMNNDLFSFDLAFSSGGNLVMIDTDSEDPIYTVLTKKQ